MRKASVVLVSLLMAVLWFALGTRRSYSEYIFTKEGPIVQGTIIGDTKESITVRTRDNKVTSVPRYKVARVIYTDLYLGKLTVRLTDGNSFLAYMVDEDAHNYTFRKVLDNPEEFKVKRKDVLFTARRNPSNLKGTADDDSVDLKWNPPYNKVSAYKIYQKAEGEKDYKNTDNSMDTVEDVGGLKSNTKYYFYVTAVDTDGEESLPSDIISLTTKNSPPRRPDNLKVERTLYKDKKKMSVKLTWDKATDPDGKVEYYNVYMKQDTGTKLQAKTRQTSHTIPNLNSQEEHQFIVRSLDDKGMESSDAEETVEAVRIEPPKVQKQEQPVQQTAQQPATLPRITIDMYGSFLLPLREYDRIADFGFAFLLSGTYNNLLLNNLMIGAETGYIFFSGGIPNIINLQIVPLNFIIRYGIRTFADIYLIPEAGFGLCWFSIYRYTYNGSLSEELVYEFYPVFTGGLAVSYRGFENISITAGARYYGIIDPAELLDFMMFYIGAGYNYR